MRVQQGGVPLVVRVESHGDAGVVVPEGELDLATRHLLDQAWGEASGQVVLDLGGITFMDCAGYQAIADARRSLGERGHSLTVRSGAGQPHRLLELIDRLQVA